MAHDQRRGGIRLLSVRHRAYDLNIGIAFAVRRYMNASDDGDFLAEAGAELLVETARMWADLDLSSMWSS
ncbi:MAG: hypothetical protein ACLP8S_07500 [Solirubrobacteraceae bacterium]